MIGQSLVAGQDAPGVTASRDGRTIFYARVDSSTDELMLVDNLG